jgi:hypothetical protein
MWRRTVELGIYVATHSRARDTCGDAQWSWRWRRTRCKRRERLLGRLLTRATRRRASGPWPAVSILYLAAGLADAEGRRTSTARAARRDSCSQRGRLQSPVDPAVRAAPSICEARACSASEREFEIQISLREIWVRVQAREGAVVLSLLDIDTPGIVMCVCVGGTGKGLGREGHSKLGVASCVFGSSCCAAEN